MHDHSTLSSHQNVRNVVLKFYEHQERKRFQTTSGTFFTLRNGQHPQTLCVCVWAQQAIVRLCSMIPEGRGAVRTDKQTHTPSFLLFFLLELPHKHTLGKPQECCDVLLGSDPSPVHLLSMERWNVRSAERQTDVGVVERRQGGKKTRSVGTTPNGTVGG